VGTEVSREGEKPDRMKDYWTRKPKKKWSQVEGGPYSPHEYRRDDGFRLYYDQQASPPCWFVNREGEAPPPDEANWVAGPDRADAAQGFADTIIEYSYGEPPYWTGAPPTP
jgi:hypothetical protein